MPIAILDSRVYRGPNIWARVPVIMLRIDIGELEQRPSNTIEGFSDALAELIPSLYEHYCSVGRPGGFLDRLREGTWMGHVIEHVALELQSLAGCDVGRGLTRSTDRPGVYNVVYQYIQPDVGLMAGEAAVRLVNWLIYREPTGYAFAVDLERLIRLAERYAYGPSTGALVEEAERRDIPVIRLDPRRSLVQMGYGVYQQRVWATVTSQTSNIAVDLARDKRLTNELLRGVGIPVPRSITVDTVDEAADAARRIGYPVVLKPLDGNHGRGVRINLRNEDDVRRNFAASDEASRSGGVVVESFIPGRDYRVLVVNGKMAACAERVPAHIVGDGTHTVAELIEIANSDPRRGIGHEKILTRITVDESVRELLAEQWLSLEATPAAGRCVPLRLTGNMSTGGTSIDRTDEIHPDNVEIAEQAAQVIGLDVAGIDIVVEDIARPIKDQGGAICEVNAGPGFRMHTHPTEGPARDVARPVIDMLFPPGSPSRIPIVAITGTNGKTTTSRMIAHILKRSGRRVGLTTTDGIYVDGTQIMQGDMSGPLSAHMVLQNPTVDCAVLETARGGILRAGLGFDRCNVSVVTNIASDHLGLAGINSIEELVQVKAVVPASTFRDGHAVLNADDPWTPKIVARSRGEIIYFGMNEQSELIRDHLRSRGTAVVLRETPQGERVTIVDGRREIAVVDVRQIPATFGGRARVNVKNALAAVAATYALNVPLETIRDGLRDFTTAFSQTPGRLNLIDVADYRVLIDYCHNVPGLTELTDFVRRLAPARAIGMLAMPGDRRDEDIVAFGEAAAAVFDEVIIREDIDLRGREPGAVAGLLRQGLIAGGMAEERITTVLDEVEAIGGAMERAEPGELVVLLVDKPVAAWETVTARTPSLAGASARHRPIAPDHEPGTAERGEG